MPEEPFALTLHAASPVGADYEAIHAAVMETARGRWFLKEYTRRNRSADTTLVLAAIEQIEMALRNPAAVQPPGHSAPGRPAAQMPPRPGTRAAPPATHALHELRDAIMLTKDSLPAIDPEGRIAFKADFGRIPSGVAAVADRMRASAEQVQETAWFLRERAEREAGALKDALGIRCNELETQARELTAACAQLDQLSESASMIAALLAEIETRLDGMIADPAQAAMLPEPVAAKPSFVVPPVAMPAREERASPPPAAAKMPVRDEPRAIAPPPAVVEIPPITTAVAAPPPVAPAPPAIAPEPPARAVTPLAARFDPAPDAVAKAAEPEPAPEIVAEVPAPHPGTPIAPPAAAVAAATPQPGPAGPRPQWMDALAPLVRARNAPDPSPPGTISFDFDDAPPALAMPNPARRETPGSDLVPPPVRPESATSAAVVEPEIARTDIASALLVPRVEVTPQTIAAPPIDEPAPAAMPEPVEPPAAVTAPEGVREPEPVFRTAVSMPDEAPSGNLATFMFDQAPEPQAAPAVNGSGERADRPAIRPAQKPADALAPIMALSEEEKIALFS